MYNQITNHMTQNDCIFSLDFSYESFANSASVQWNVKTVKCKKKNSQVPQSLTSHGGTKPACICLRHDNYLSTSALPTRRTARMQSNPQILRKKTVSIFTEQSCYTLSSVFPWQYYFHQLRSLSMLSCVVNGATCPIPYLSVTYLLTMNHFPLISTPPNDLHYQHTPVPSYCCRVCQNVCYSLFMQHQLANISVIPGSLPLVSM